MRWKKYVGIELSRYNILDINDLDNKELLQEENIISKLLVIEKANTEKEFIESLKEILNELNGRHYSKEELKLCEITIKAMIKNRFNKKEAEQILQNLKIERGDNMFRVEEMFKREEKRYRNEGRIEERVKIIKNMLREKLSINIIASVSGMNEKEIKKIAKEIN